MAETEDVDVVVVGAGVSGLTSAYHLRNKDPNLKVVVLEAKDRVGGRTVLQELKGARGPDVWDMGGQWVSSCQPHVMSLLDELGLEVYPQYTTGRKVLQLGDHRVRTYTSDIPSMSLPALIDMHLFMAKVDKWQRSVPVENPGLCPDAERFDGLSLAEALREYGWTKSMREAFEAACRTMFGAEPAEMSLLYFLTYCRAAGGLPPLIEAKANSGQEFKVKGGAGQIARLLADRVRDVRLSQPVASIVQTADGVTVTTTPGLRLRCSRVIMATPPHQTVKMEFSPMLPTEKLHVLQKMPVGYITKVIVTYPKAFWREAGYSGEVVTAGGPPLVDDVTTGPLSIAYDATSANGSPALLSFIGGRQQREYNKLPAEARQKAVVESFASYFGPEARHFVDYAEKDWGQEPYSGGGPVCVGTPGMMRGSGSGLRDTHLRVHFAGTESATVWCGFINGAVQAGYRAASEVLYNVRPQLVTSDDLEGTTYDPRSGRRAGPTVTSAGYRRAVWVTVTVGAVGLIGAVLARHYLR